MWTMLRAMGERSEGSGLLGYRYAFYLKTWMHKHDYLEPYTSELRSSIKVNDSSLHLVLSERDECPKEMNRYMNGIDRKCYTMIPHDILSVHNSDA